MSEWIPVTDRLPEHEVDVLCCDGVFQYVAQIYFYHDGHTTWHQGDGICGDCTVYTPIAWQPLPAPYKG